MLLKSRKKNNAQKNLSISTPDVQIDKNRFCMRCGNCCKGLVWKKWFSFETAFSIAGKNASRLDMEEKLIEHYRKYLATRGQVPQKVPTIEWDEKNKRIMLQTKVETCKYLDYEENKAICLNYKDRSNECRNYLCKKVRQRVMIKMNQQDV